MKTSGLIKMSGKTIVMFVIIALFFTGKAKSQWMNMNNLIYAEFYKGAGFIDANNIIAVGANGKIMKTTDGGINWLPKASNTTSYLQRVFVIEENNIFVIGGGGTILKSTDGGNTWEAKTSGTIKDLLGIYFSDANNGIIVGGRDYNNSGVPLDYNNVILKTTNGGETWTTIQDNEEGIYTGLCFVNSSTGIAVGKDDYPQESIIIKTTDGGNTWRKINFSCTIFFTAIDFANETTGFISGLNGRIYKTTDGGENWAEVYSSTNSVIWDITAISEKIAYASCSHGIIIETFDGGNSWTEVSTPVTYELRGIYHYNNDYAMAFGYEGTVLKKENIMSVNENIFKKDEITVYPTYIKDKAIVNNIDKISDVIIINSLGCEVEKLKINGNIKELDFTSMKKGLYIIKLMNNNEVICTRKVIKY